MKKIFSVLLLVSLVGCITPSASHEANSTLYSCHPNSKPWDVFPGHFYDKEIHLVPIASEYNPTSANKSSNTSPMGYSVVFVKTGSYYDSVGIQNGDVINSIDGKDLIFKSPASLSEEDRKIFLKIKEGKKFSLQRCLKHE